MLAPGLVSYNQPRPCLIFWGSKSILDNGAGIAIMLMVVESARDVCYKHTTLPPPLFFLLNTPPHPTHIFVLLSPTEGLNITTSVTLSSFNMKLCFNKLTASAAIICTSGYISLYIYIRGTNEDAE